MRKKNFAAQHAAVRRHNDHMMLTIFKTSYDHILKQGKGCIIENYGPVYYNKDDGTNDVLGIYFTKKSILKWCEGITISDDRSKHMVRHLIRTFMIDLSILGERERFIDFLQLMQDAHDFSFDPYERAEDPMKSFTTMMDSIKIVILKEQK
jgi:hypothetical protein